MIYDKVTILYATSDESEHLVRYDLIEMSEHCVVKVLDEHSSGISHQKSIVQIDEFIVSRSEFDARYRSSPGFPSVVKLNHSPQPTFLQFVKDEIKKHRSSMAC
ncbi:hypothetical protein [Edwardsiella anguillarum]|uniref:Uncharacterized protein n=1 Tax=Edwardsiella anguillarum ET080813 TaxID=667120 RepID=A0A076LKL1_9GAMM|nr:hypothetical protein [Edwardsiella anguillarum]AIJ07322.1 Hypothetical protein ETEE_0852 [Edwardsiella anguillarum ET080813]